MSRSRETPSRASSTRRLVSGCKSSASRLWAEGQKLERYERLLLDARMHLSAQGLAAYPGDAEREPRDRLDHAFGRRPSRVNDPGAGGPKGAPDAFGPKIVDE